MQDGGPIGLIQNGDIITIDVQKRRMDVQLTDEELAERRKKWTAPAYKATQGILYKVCEKNSGYHLQQRIIFFFFFLDLFIK